MKTLGIVFVVFGIMAVFGILPFAGTDVAKLEPVEVVALSWERNRILVQTDTQEQGRGQTLEATFADLKESADGQVFLETAQYLLLEKDQIHLLPELKTFLRPSCNICIWSGQGDLQDIAQYLEVHHPGLTLLRWLADKSSIPVLKIILGGIDLEC